jgi:hypothetical protein
MFGRAHRMTEPVHEFVHGGKRFVLTRTKVEADLAGEEPEVVQQLAAWVNTRWFPVKQVIRKTLRINPNSRIAFNHLKAAGVPVHDSKADGPLPPRPPTLVTSPAASASPAGSRREALDITVELLKGTPGLTAAQVIACAEDLDAWLRMA